MKKFNVYECEEFEGRRKFEINVRNGEDENGCFNFEVEVIDDLTAEIIYFEKFDNIRDCLKDVAEVEESLYEKYMINNSGENDIKINMSVSVFGNM